MDKFEFSVYRSNKVFVLEMPTGKLYILSRKALVFNLKKVFNVTKEQGIAIMSKIDLEGVSHFNVEANREVA